MFILTILEKIKEIRPKFLKGSANSFIKDSNI